MKGYKSKILVGIITSILLIATAICSLIIANKKNISNSTIQNMKPEQLNNGESKITSNDLIVRSTKLLGGKYTTDGKGVNVKSIYSETVNSGDLKSYSEAKASGLDCSGFIYYVLTSLGFNTVGFKDQNPVPYDTWHWYENQGLDNIQINNSNNEGYPRKVITYKANEEITANCRYYQDSAGKEIPAGSIIISKNPNGEYTKDHSWIYLGDLGTNDPNKVIEYLKSIGADENDLKGNVIKTSDSTHWRIESSSDVGIRIDNTDPDANSVEGEKIIGTIWAFQIVDEVGNYDIQVLKVDENGNSIGLKTNPFKVEKIVNGQSQTFTSYDLNSAGISWKESFDASVGTVLASYKITENNAPDNYIRFDKEISFDIIVDKVNGKKIGTVSNFKIGDKTTETPNGTPYQYGDVDIQFANGHIIVKVKNKKKRKYNMLINKTNTSGTAKSGAEFSVKSGKQQRSDDESVSDIKEVNINKKSGSQFTTNDFTIDSNEYNDIYTITETKPATNCVGIEHTIVLQVVKKSSLEIDHISVYLTKNGINEKNLKDLMADKNNRKTAIGVNQSQYISEGKTKFTISLKQNTIQLDIKNDEIIEGGYGLEVVKTDKETGAQLTGAQFKLTESKQGRDDKGEITDSKTSSNNNFISKTVQITENTYNDLFVIEETSTPTGYLGTNNIAVIQVVKRLDGTNYIFDHANFYMFKKGTQITTQLLKNSSTNLIGTFSKNSTKTLVFDEEKVDEQTSNSNLNKGTARFSAEISFNDTEKPILKISVQNQEMPGNYNLKITKKNQNGENLDGSNFDIRKIEQDENGDILTNFSSKTPEKNETGIFKIINEPIKSKIYNNVRYDATQIVDVYVIDETTTPTGYYKPNKKIVLQIFKRNDNTNYSLDYINIWAFNKNTSITTTNLQDLLNKKSSNFVGIWKYDGKGTNTENGGELVSYSNENDVFELSVKNGEINLDVTNNPKVDLALKKTITEITDTEGNTYKVTKNNGFNTSRDFSESGNKVITYKTKDETIGIDLSHLKSGESTNATYYMNKTPVEVKAGEKITYSIKIFNEGSISSGAYEVNDYIPTGLKVTNVKYVNNSGEETVLNNQSDSLNKYNYDENNGVLTIKLNDTQKEKLIPAFDPTKSEISYDEILVTCEVLPTATKVLTNVAEITKYKIESGPIEKDIDSISGNWKNPNDNKTENNVTTDKGTDEWRNYRTGKSSISNGGFYNDFLAQDNNGVGDDDDFDKVIIKGSYKFDIKKSIDGIEQTSSDDNNIKFNIKRTTTKMENNNSRFFENEPITYSDVTIEQALKGQEIELSTLESGTVIYEIEEQKNSKYAQLDETLKITLQFTEGKLSLYNVVKGNTVLGGDTVSGEKTFNIISNNIPLTVKIKSDFENSHITVELENKTIKPSDYALRFRKISSVDGKPLQGVTFKGTKQVNNGEIEDIGLNSTNENGYTNILKGLVSPETGLTSDIYKITELDLGQNTGFTKLEKEITVNVVKSLDENGNYFVKEYKISADGKTININKNNTSKYIEIQQNGKTYFVEAKLENIDGIEGLTIAIPNIPDKPAKLVIKKISNETGEQLAGAEFEVYNYKTNAKLSEKLNSDGKTKEYEDNYAVTTTELSYKIIEVNAPDGYDNIFAGKSIKIDVSIVNEVVSSANATVYNSDNTVNSELTNQVSVNIVNGEIVVQIKNPETKKTVDLALRKVIVKINDKDVNSLNGFDSKYDRITTGDDKVRIDTTPLKQGKTNANYYLNKTPILVTKGSKIEYQIRIYNESSEIDATASKIKDYLPSGLDVKEVYYRDEKQPLELNKDYVISEDGKTLEIKALDDRFIEKYDDSTDTIKLNYDYVTVVCTVNNSASGIQTNIAEISEYKTKDAYNKIETVDSDRDSEPANWRNPVTNNSSDNNSANRNNQNWIDYSGKTTNTIESGAYKNYVGQQDDDDFEKIEVGEIDLVLKKVIEKIGDTSVNDLSDEYKRFQDGKIKIDTTEMNEHSNVTTAKYFMNKTPIKVNVNDLITYQIRIYNEGSIDGVASEIKDYIPKGLTFESVSYGRKVLTKQDYSINSENVLTITGLKNKFIPKYDGIEPKYEYVTVVCKVNGSVNGLLTNIAEITQYQTYLGTTNIDRDSQTTGNGEFKINGTDKNTLEGRNTGNWAHYYDNTTPGQFADYPLQQDDDDFEKIYVTNKYTIRLKKISMNTDKGLKDIKFKVSGRNGSDQEFVTGSDGFITIGTFDLDENGLDNFEIEELEANGYSKLSSVIQNYPVEIRESKFNVFVKKQSDINGTNIELGSVFINFISPRPDVEGIEITKEGTVYTTDEDGNIIPVSISRSIGNTGDVVLDITIGNYLKSGQYTPKIVKVDENGNIIDGTVFNISTNNKYRTYDNYEITTTQGFAQLGEFKITSFNLDEKDLFTINEIKTPTNDYYKLANRIELEITKEVTNSEFKVSGIKLICDGYETEEGQEVTLKNVYLENNRDTVDITAKLDENDIIITIPNKRKKLDLALRKYIVKTGEEIVNRWSEPYIDISNLIDDDPNTTTAVYNNSKDPIQVHVKDVVTYGISVYNEGDTDGYAEYIIDDIPDGVTMIAPEYDSNGNPVNLNAEFGWKMYELVKESAVDTSEGMITYYGNTYVVTDDPSKAVIIGTDYWAKGKEHDGITGLMKSFNSAKIGTVSLDSREVQVQFKVNANAEPGVIIENKAQIYKHSDSTGNTDVTDIDSTPGIWEDYPRDDDQDIERIIVVKEKEFDLSLRKFITKVNNTDVEVSREPVVDCSKLVSGESTTAEYTHTKEPVLVNPQDIVDYTIRVYNEGELDGFANLVMDDIPEGVEMIAPDYQSDGKPNNMNAEYGWFMYRKIGVDENESELMNNSEFVNSENSRIKPIITYENEKYVITSDPKQAVLILTDYLSIEKGNITKLENGEQVNSNLLKAFNPEVGKMTEENYRDIKVQFKVKDLVDPRKEAGKLITNYAQITDDSTSDGSSVTDRDSTPNIWENPPRDDDQDKDVLTVGYFDLALYKWVTTATVTENGKTKEYVSNHTQNDKTNLVNVSIPKNSLNNVVVKFKYTIKIENEGTIPGKATEIKDHIPQGLKFVAEDNTSYGWKQSSDGDDTIVTDYLKDTILAPGQTAEVQVVLTWINGSDNLGQKVNYAEISEDSNDYDWPDVDSTPNNFPGTPTEDDEDGDVVQLEIRTGVSTLIIIYTLIIVAGLSIVAVGTYGIKKFVVNK